jgi:copper transport protein
MVAERRQRTAIRLKRLGGILIVLYALVATAGYASAHAVLERTQPPAGARVDRAPQRVVLTFDDRVDATLGYVRVLDATGTNRSIGPIVHPDGDPARVAIRVNALQRGRYVVSWRVIADDAHAVAGAYAFGVGVPAGPAPPQPGDATGAVVLAIVHGGMLAGVLLAVGLPIGAATVGRRARRPPGFVEFGAWPVLAFAAFADVATRAGLDGSTLGAALTTRAGELRLATMAAAIVAAVVVGRQRRPPALLAAACIAAIVSLSAAGHAADGDPAILGVAADALHVLAAATWIGVLAIATTLEPSDELRAVSPAAMAAVCAIVATGVIQTIRNVGSVGALVATAYGREIDAKIALMLVALGFALLSRRALARGRFGIGGFVKAELWLLSGVVAVTAVLVESAPPR